jgi:hypothetical protein
MPGPDGRRAGGRRPVDLLRPEPEERLDERVDERVEVTPLERVPDRGRVGVRVATRAA